MSLLESNIQWIKAENNFHCTDTFKQMSNDHWEQLKSKAPPRVSDIYFILAPFDGSLSISISASPYRVGEICCSTAWCSAGPPWSAPDIDSCSPFKEVPWLWEILLSSFMWQVFVFTNVFPVHMVWWGLYRKAWHIMTAAIQVFISLALGEIIWTYTYFSFLWDIFSTSLLWVCEVFSAISTYTASWDWGSGGLFKETSIFISLSKSFDFSCQN